MPKENKTGLSGWIILALIFLANPNIHIIDILPDFFSYIIIVRALSYAKDRAPYFEEAITDFKRLAVLSMLKLPALLIQTKVRSGNIGENDILALFAFTFGVVELVWLISAVRHLFDAFYYLGERSDASAILSSHPESLRALAIFFSVLKCTAYALPETFLLTKGVSAGNAHTVFNIARLYPYFVVIFVPLVLAVGIITVVRFKRYLATICEGNAFFTALDSLVDDDGRAQLKRKESVSDMSFALTLLAVASIFTLELRLDSLDKINLLPRIIFGLLLLYAVFRLRVHVKWTAKALIPFAIYSLVALAAFICESVFLWQSGYAELSSSSAARAMYLNTIIGYTAELIALTVAVIFAARLLTKFSLLHTGIERESDKYSRVDADYHKKMKTKVSIWATLAIVGGVCRTFNVVFKYFARDIKVTVDDPEAIVPVTSIVTEGMLPWFGVVVFALTVAFIAYSFYLTSLFKEDAELKYL